MADATGVDAVVVASRTAGHAGDILTLACHGVAVMVEKPVASSIADPAETASS